MPRAELGKWLPDQPEVGPPHLMEAKNVLPQATAYGPLASLTETTDALTARCRGVVGVRDINQLGRVYAGDSTKLYELDGTAWTDRSKVGGYGPAVDRTRWRFTTYGDRLIAVNGIDPVQYIDMTSGASAFANLAGSPGIAEYVVSFGEFVVLAVLSTSAYTIKWSGLGDSEEWTPGTNQSDEQEFTDGGIITGMVATRSACFIFQEHCIRRMIHVGGDVIMQIDKVSDGIGCASGGTIVRHGQLIFFMDENGWYVFDGENQPQPIGVGQWSDWFLADASRSYWYSMSSVVDPLRRILAVAYASINVGTGEPDTILFYNYATDKASYARVNTEVLFNAVSLGTSPDDLVGIVADDLTNIGPDDPFWLGGAVYFAAMSTSHKLGSFSGDAMEATLEWGESPMFDGRRASVEWIKPVADTTAATVAGGSKVRPGDTITYQSAVSQQDSGRCPQRGVNGFYLAARIVVPAAETWTYASGLEWSARQAGMR